MNILPYKLKSTNEQLTSRAGCARCPTNGVMKSIDTQFTSLAETTSYEKTHGQVSSRRAQLFSLDSLSLDSRWKSMI